MRLIYKLSIFGFIFFYNCLLNAAVFTSSPQEYWSEAYHDIAFNIYWCDDIWHTPDYPDFFIIKYSDTGSSFNFGITLVKSSVDERGWKDPDKVINLGYHYQAKVTDLNNDGICEITAVIHSYGRKWGPNAGESNIRKIFSVKNEKLVDVTNEMPKERDLLNKEETERLIELYKTNKYYSSGYHPDQTSMSPALNFWYHIFAINPNAYGISLFNKYRTFTLSNKHAKEVEDALLEEGYWSEEFYKSHPLLSLIE